MGIFQQCIFCREWGWDVRRTWGLYMDQEGVKLCGECCAFLQKQGTVVSRSVEADDRTSNACERGECSCHSHNGFLTKKGYEAYDAQEELDLRP